MKLKTTKKQIKNQARKILNVGYCSIQHLLRYKEPFAYTCGVYGWNADFYNMDDDVIICTGYRGFGDMVDHEILYKYEKQAQAICENYTIKYDKKIKQVNTLLEKFLKDVLKCKN